MTAKKKKSSGTWESKKHRDYKYRDKKRGNSYAFSLEQSKALFHLPCFYCTRPEAKGMDRMDNDVGYETGNVVPCCTTCNTILSTLPKEAKMEMREGLRRIYEKDLLKDWKPIYMVEAKAKEEEDLQAKPGPVFEHDVGEEPDYPSEGTDQLPDYANADNVFYTDLAQAEWTEILNKHEVDEPQLTHEHDDNVGLFVEPAPNAIISADLAIAPDWTACYVAEVIPDLRTEAEKEPGFGGPECFGGTDQWDQQDFDSIERALEEIKKELIVAQIKEVQSSPPIVFSGSFEYFPYLGGPVKFDLNPFKWISHKTKDLK